MKLSWAIKLLTASTIVFLLAGILSISLLALSATQMKITPGTPKAEVTETSAKITIPIQISNQGFLTIKSLTLQTTILDKNSEKLAEGKTGPLDVPTKSDVEVPVSVTLDFKAITPEALRRLAFNDESFTIDIRGGLSLDPLLSLALSARTVLQWGAPLYDFKVGEPTFTPRNVTHILVSVPITFTNKSPYFAVSGRIVAKLYDEADISQGTGLLKVDAPKGSQYQRSLELLMRLPQDLQKLLFTDETLRYRVELQMFMGETAAYTFTEPIEIRWGAPVLNLKLGKPAYQLLNLTHVTMILPFNFTNNSPFIELDATMKGELYDTAGNLVGSSGPTAFVVPSGTFYKGEVTGPVKASVVAAGTIQLRIIFTTLYGTFTKEVSLVA